MDAICNSVIAYVLAIRMREHVTDTRARFFRTRSFLFESGGWNGQMIDSREVCWDFLILDFTVF